MHYNITTVIMMVRCFQYTHSYTYIYVLIFNTPIKSNLWSEFSFKLFRFQSGYESDNESFFVFVSLILNNNIVRGTVHMPHTEYSVWTFNEVRWSLLGKWAMLSRRECVCNACRIIAFTALACSHLHSRVVYVRKHMWCMPPMIRLNIDAHSLWAVHSHSH